MSSWVLQSCQDHNTSSNPPKPLSVKIFLSPLLMWSLSLGEGHAEHIDVPFVAECSTGTFSPKLDQLRASVSATFHCTKTAPWWSLRAALTYGWKDLNIKCSLILYSFSKITVTGSCPGFMGSVTMVCNQIHSIRLVIPPMKWVLNHKTILSCLSLLFSGGSQLAEFVNDFSTEQTL